MSFLYFILVNSISIECSALKSLAFGLGMQSRQPTIFSRIQANCCTSDGIRCSPYNRVLLIDWGVLNLNGVINSTALNLMSELTSFDVHQNQITGPPPSNFPRSSKLKRMDIGGNSIVGALLDFPPSLEWLHCDETLISGKLPALPDNLQEMRFGSSSLITGSLYAKSLKVLFAFGSQISRIFIDDFSAFSIVAQYKGFGWCEINEANIYATQVAYLSDVCRISNAISNTECQVVSQIARNLSMNTVDLIAYNTLGSSCCSGHGITCDDLQHVIGINWSGMSLSGTLDTTQIELLYSYLQSFNISNNSVNGIFSDDFTTNLVDLDLSGNRLEGEFGNIRFNKMRRMDVSRNQFTGNLGNLPKQLTALNVSNNNFNGPIPWFPSTVQFDFSANNLTDQGKLNNLT